MKITSVLSKTSIILRRMRRVRESAGTGVKMRLAGYLDKSVNVCVQGIRV